MNSPGTTAPKESLHDWLMSERPQLLQGVFRVMSRQLKSVVMDLPSRRGLSGETRIPDDNID